MSKRMKIADLWDYLPPEAREKQRIMHHAAKTGDLRCFRKESHFLPCLPAAQVEI